MKTFICFLLIFIKLSSESDVNFIASALSQSALSSVFTKRRESFDLMYYGNETRKLRSIASKVAKISKMDSMLIDISKYRKQIVVNRSAILLIENLYLYSDYLNRAIIERSNPKNLNFFVYMEEFIPMVHFFGKRNILKPSTLFRHENFLYFDTPDTLRLITFEIFKRPKCREWMVVELARFARGEKPKEVKFLDKFKTFNGCPLKIKMPVPQPKVLEYDYTKKRYTGYAAVFNEIISKSLNYTSDFIYYNQDQNKTDAKLEDFELHADSMRKIKARKSPLYTTRSYTVVDEIFLISRPHPYTQFEKVFMPFEDEVWWWLIATLSVALVVICILKCMPKNVQNFVFGRNINTPIMNFM
jgi:hypothetical protein